MMETKNRKSMSIAAIPDGSISFARRIGDKYSLKYRFVPILRLSLYACRGISDSAPSPFFPGSFFPTQWSSQMPRIDHHVVHSRVLFLPVICRRSGKKETVSADSGSTMLSIRFATCSFLRFPFVIVFQHVVK
jgi:hypothetical protein